MAKLDVASVISVKNTKSVKNTEWTRSKTKWKKEQMEAQADGSRADGSRAAAALEVAAQAGHTHRVQVHIQTSL